MLRSVALPKAGRSIAVSSVLLALVLASAPPVSAEDPYVEVTHAQGYIPWAVAWDVSTPETGCIIVDGTPSPLTPKTCGGIRGGGAVNGEVVVNVTAGVETLIIELTWEESLPNTHLQLDFFCDDVPRGPGGSVLDPDHPCYNLVGGESSLRVRVDSDDWAGGEYDPVGEWAARVFATTQSQPGVGYALEQTFDMYISVFYHEAAPEDYTAIP